jgi:hypothetical protein
MNYIEKLIARHPELDYLASSLDSAVGAILFTHSYNGKLLLVGNGGSAGKTEDSKAQNEAVGGFSQRFPRHAHGKYPPQTA